MMKGKALRKHILHEKTAASVLFSGPQGSWSVHVCCLHLKMEFCSCARGVSGVASFITTDEQLQ